MLSYTRAERVILAGVMRTTLTAPLPNLYARALTSQWSASATGRRAYREDWKKWLVGLFCSQKPFLLAIYIKGWKMQRDLTNALLLRTPHWKCLSETGWLLPFPLWMLRGVNLWSCSGYFIQVQVRRCWGCYTTMWVWSKLRILEWKVPWVLPF